MVRLTTENPPTWIRPHVNQLEGHLGGSEAGRKRWQVISDRAPSRNGRPSAALSVSRPISSSGQVTKWLELSFERARCGSGASVRSGLMGPNLRKSQHLRLRARIPGGRSHRSSGFPSGWPCPAVCVFLAARRPITRRRPDDSDGQLGRASPTTTTRMMDEQASGNQRETGLLAF